MLWELKHTPGVLLKEKTTMDVMIFKVGNEMIWNLLGNGRTLVSLYKNIDTDYWAMEYEGIGIFVPETQAINLIKGWKKANYNFMSIPTNFSRLFNEKGMR